MDRKPYTIESVRDACEIRTMLAYPYGTRTWLPNQYVLDDIKDAYPGVWQEWLAKRSFPLERASPYVRLRRYVLTWVLSVSVLNVLLQLARRELAEQDAIAEIKTL